MKRKIVRLISSILIAVIAVACLWYFRPVDIYELAPGMEVDKISATLIRNGGGASLEDRTFYIEQGEEGFEDMLSRMEELRFRRPPTNLLLYPFPFLEGIFDSKAHVIEDHEYQLSITLLGEDDFWYLDLYCDVDRWDYINFERRGLFSLVGTGETKNSKVLGDELWAMAEPKPEPEQNVLIQNLSYELPEGLTIGEYDPIIAAGGYLLLPYVYFNESNSAPEYWKSAGAISCFPAKGAVEWDNDEIIDVNLHINHTSYEKIGPIQNMFLPAYLLKAEHDLMTLPELMEYEESGCSDTIDVTSEYWYVVLAEPEAEFGFLVSLATREYTKEEMIDFVSSFSASDI